MLESKNYHKNDSKLVGQKSDTTKVSKFGQSALGDKIVLDHKHESKRTHKKDVKKAEKPQKREAVKHHKPEAKPRVTKEEKP